MFYNRNNMVRLTKKRIMIIGCSCSGKSYFARQLRDITGIPVYYMDRLYWRENWTHVSELELSKEVETIIEKDEWIIDGDYFKSIEQRMAKADIIYYLDMPIELCIEQESRRRGSKREDLPEYLKEEYDPEFINWIKDYETKRKPKTLELLNKYKNKEIYIFKSQEDKNNYLSELRKAY